MRRIPLVLSLLAAMLLAAFGLVGGTVNHASANPDLGISISGDCGGATVSVTNPNYYIGAVLTTAVQLNDANATILNENTVTIQRDVYNYPAGLNPLSDGTEFRYAVVGIPDQTIWTEVLSCGYEQPTEVPPTDTPYVEDTPTPTCTSTPVPTDTPYVPENTPTSPSGDTPTPTATTPSGGETPTATATTPSKSGPTPTPGKGGVTSLPNTGVGSGGHKGGDVELAILALVIIGGIALRVRRNRMRQRNS